MGKRKQDPSKAGLGSPDVRGQGTAAAEIGEAAAPSSRKKKKKIIRKDPAGFELPSVK
ncbi:YuzL family protein [Bacillus xiapuensis]|uniref:YuzL family protein n=1 Tax=Bacillus xiapuensis TaxID=2014075 RepID=UPI000C2346B1